MRYFYRFLQIIFLLLILGYISFIFSEKGNVHAWTAHITTLAIFLGIIALIEYVIRANYASANKLKVETAYLSKPLELKYSKRYLLTGMTVILGLILLSIRMFEESKIIISIICVGLIFVFYKYAHFGDFRFWNWNIIRVDSRGISHYKYGFISWDKVREINQHRISHRGIKLGKVIQIRLANSLKPNRSRFYKKWEGILFRDTRLIALPVSFFDKQDDFTISVIENFFRENGGIDMTVIKQQQADYDKLVELRQKAKSRNAHSDEITAIDKRISSALDKIGEDMSRLYDDMGDEQLKNLYQTKKSIEDQERKIRDALDEYIDAGTKVDQATFSMGMTGAAKLPELLKELAEINEKIDKRQRYIQNTKAMSIFVGIVIVLLVYGVLNFIFGT